MAMESQKRCLYEVLGVSRDCSQDEIRSAYRRLALLLHPDKVAASGATDIASATTAFQELLHAYEVLSDPKERSWYDAHCSRINLSFASKDQNSSSFFDIDLFSFISTSAFSGYSDSGKGFYKVYGDLFTKAYAQEIWFVKQMGLGADTVAPAPLIGNLESQYSQVTAFYNYWLGFSTVMDFCWVDEYNVSVGPNRRCRRAMEEENKKLRKKARREYNDSIRGLVAFVKKRDKRVVDMMVKKKLEEEKRRSEEVERKKEEARKKLETARLYEEAEWTQINEQDDGPYDWENDDKMNSREEFYCVACNKKFKSDKQWKNHEQSKKHRDKVAELRMTFEEEDKEYAEEEEDDGGVHACFDYNPSKSEESDVIEELTEKIVEDRELSQNDSESEHLEDKDDEAKILEAMVAGHQNKKIENSDHYDSLLNRNYHSESAEESSIEYDSQRGGHKKRASKKGTSEVPNQESSTENYNESPSSSVEASVLSEKDQPSGKNQKYKKQQVAASKGSGKKVTPTHSNTLPKGRKQKANSKSLSNACGTCGETFDTRNKLFAHLGESGHATLKSK